MSAFSFDYSHRSVTLLHVPAFLSRHGVRAAPIFQSVGIELSHLSNPEIWVERDKCFALEEEVVRATGDILFGARQASAYHLEELGVWGKTTSSAPSLRAAFQFAATTMDTLQRGTIFNCQNMKDKLRITYEFSGSGAVHPVQHLTGAMTVLRKIAFLAGEPDAVSIRLSATRSPAMSELEQFLGARIEFGCDQNAIEIDRSIIDMPLVRSPLTRNHGAETAADVGAVISQMLPYGRINRDKAASYLQMSSRTMRRRLQDWGVSFEELLDDTRRSQAMALLQKGQLNLLEITYHLGYSDPAHFTRAFKRWTGMTPKAYQKMHFSMPV